MDDIKDIIKIDLELPPIFVIKTKSKRQHRKAKRLRTQKNKSKVKKK